MAKIRTLEDYYAGPLVPACGGTERPFTVNGRRWLYCYHRRSRRHVYLDLDRDQPVWNRNFHPAFAPEFEDAPDDLAPTLPSAALEERTERLLYGESPVHSW